MQLEKRGIYYSTNITTAIVSVNILVGSCSSPNHVTTVCQSVRLGVDILVSLLKFRVFVFSDERSGLSSVGNSLSHFLNLFTKAFALHM